MTDSVSFAVVSTFPVTGIGPTAVGILEDGVIPVTGMTLHVEATGVPVRIRSFDLHTRETPDGLQVGLFLDQRGASKVSPGSVLMTSES